MMIQMITVTCVCGQQQFVAAELAGRSHACVVCGARLKMPAMGVLLTRDADAKPQASRMKARAALLLVAVGLLVLLAVGAWLLPGASQHVEVAEYRAKLPVELPPPRKETPRPIEERSDAVKKITLPLPTLDPPKVVDPVQVTEKPSPPKETPVEKKPIAVAEPVKLVWKLKKADVFFQEVIVAQKPNFKVGGLPVAALLNYRIVSRFTVNKREGDGSLSVEQKIESAKLLLADDLSKATVETAIAKLPGTVYTLQLSPKMDVTKFAGAAGGMNFANLGLGFQSASLIDRDGWKELAQSTFFQLDQTPKANLRWSKPMTHNWGSLGAWHGQIHYAYAGEQAKLHRVTYGLQLAYKMPAAGAIGLMTVNSANFKTPEATGVLLFDAARGRVVAAEERFRVQGLINANVLGQNTLIEIDEDQHFVIRIHDKLP